MDARLKRDLDWFFQVYQNRTAGIVNGLPAPARQVLIDELHLLMDSIYNRLDEEMRH